MVGRWGLELQAGDRLREAGGIVDSRDMGLLCWGSPHLTPRDMVGPVGSGALGWLAQLWVPTSLTKCH